MAIEMNDMSELQIVIKRGPPQWTPNLVLHHKLNAVSSVSVFKPNVDVRIQKTSLETQRRSAFIERCSPETMNRAPVLSYT